MRAELIYRWGTELIREGSFPGHSKPKHTPEKAELAQLKKYLREVEIERDMDQMLTHVCGSKRPSASFPGETGEIRIHKRIPHPLPVEKMCQVLGVSIRGYYYWRQHPRGWRAGKEQQLLACIKKVYQQSDGRSGSPGT